MLGRSSKLTPSVLMRIVRTLEAASMVTRIARPNRAGCGSERVAYFYVGPIPDGCDNRTENAISSILRVFESLPEVATMVVLNAIVEYVGVHIRELPEYTDLCQDTCTAIATGLARCRIVRKCGGRLYVAGSTDRLSIVSSILGAPFFAHARRTRGACGQ